MDEAKQAQEMDERVATRKALEKLDESSKEAAGDPAGPQIPAGEREEDEALDFVQRNQDLLLKTLRSVQSEISALDAEVEQLRAQQKRTDRELMLIGVMLAVIAWRGSKILSLLERGAERAGEAVSDAAS